MIEINYRGLLIRTDCKYFQAKESCCNSLYEDKTTSVLTLNYSPNSTALALSEALGIELVGGGSLLMIPSPIKKIKKTTITLNGLVLEKQTYDSHILHIIIVKDSKSKVVQEYFRTTLVINEEDYKNQDFIQYLIYSNQLLYLKPIGPKLSYWELRNFPRHIINDRDLVETSNSTVVYSLRSKYDDYLIRAIDYQSQFVLEIKKILEDYGIQLVRFNKEETLSTTNYVTYQFNQTPQRVNHPFRRGGDSDILDHVQPVELSLHTTDMVLYHDFKNKYNNVNLLTNFCNFKTPDKYGERWLAAIKWGQITEEFNHQYLSDDNSNLSLQCQFRCELYFYEVFDTKQDFLKEISSIINSEEG